MGPELVAWARTLDRGELSVEQLERLARIEDAIASDPTRCARPDEIRAVRAVLALSRIPADEARVALRRIAEHPLESRSVSLARALVYRSAAGR